MTVATDHDLDSGYGQRIALNINGLPDERVRAKPGWGLMLFPWGGGRDIARRTIPHQRPFMVSLTNHKRANPPAEWVSS